MESDAPKPATQNVHEPEVHSLALRVQGSELPSAHSLTMDCADHSLVEGLCLACVF